MQKIMDIENGRLPTLFPDLITCPAPLSASYLHKASAFPVFCFLFRTNIIPYDIRENSESGSYQKRILSDKIIEIYALVQP